MHENDYYESQDSGPPSRRERVCDRGDLGAAEMFCFFLTEGWFLKLLLYYSLNHTHLKALFCITIKQEEQRKKEKKTTMKSW